MARRRRRSADASDIANIGELLAPVEMPSAPVSHFDDFLGPVLPHDRREFSFHEPELFSLVSPAIESPQRGRVVHPVHHASPFDVPSQVHVKSPDTVAVCVRRQRRKEVLHALRKTGKGARRRNRRRNEWSNIKC